MNYDKFINKKVAAIPKSGIRKFFDIVATMPDAISLGVGEPDFVTPWEYRKEAIISIKSGDTHYTANRGLAPLLDEIALYLKTRFNLEYTPNQDIIVTVGASEGIDLALRSLVTDGDEVLIPEPSYVSYCPNVTLTGGVAVPIVTEASDGFKLHAQEIERAVTPKTKLLILPYPNNPTGATLSESELKSIAAVIKKHDLMVISDEIYAELTYGSRHVSIANIAGMKERTVLVSGFSKAFAMTGWRLGYVAAPNPIADVMLKIHQYVIMCASTASQRAALAALKDGRDNGYEHVESMREKYDERRRFTVSALNDIGLKCVEPMGAFYAFPSVTAFCNDGETFASNLLAQKKVATVPGSAFGACGAGHIRCTYASSIKDLAEAMRRIEDFCKAIKEG